MGDCHRGGDLDLLGAHLASGLVSQQGDELIDQRAEDGRRRSPVAQDGELVVDERVIGNVKTHEISLRVRARPTCRTAAAPVAVTSPAAFTALLSLLLYEEKERSKGERGAVSGFRPAGRVPMASCGGRPGPG